MSFLSRFSSKNRSSSSKNPPVPSKDPKSTTSTLSPSVALPLVLPSPSLLDDSTLPLPLPSKSFGDETASVQSGESSPWVKVGGDATPAPASTSGTEEQETVGARKEREAREKKKLGRAVLGIGEVTVLMKECGAVVRERGLTTVGIFRPYRVDEDVKEVQRLSLLFLAYASDFSSKTNGGTGSNSVAKDLFGAGLSKEAKLEKFKTELKYAGVHDVIGVLKWGLRHLSYSTSFSGSTPASLDWYTKYLSTISSTPSSTTSFHTQLLPSLPTSSQAFLLATLDLLQAISAFVETNAMSSRKLSRTLGLYIFGLAPSPSLASGRKEVKDWEELYRVWKDSGDALEGVFKEFLRSQKDLPVRLMEIVEGRAGGRTEGSLKKRVVRVEVESRGEWETVEDEEVNDQVTGRVGGAGGGKKGGEGKAFRRRQPLEVLLAAFESSKEIEVGEGDGDEVKKAWKLVVRTGTSEGPKTVFDDETRRILQLVGLDELPTTSDKDNNEITPSNSVTSSPSSPTLSRPRRRSFSHDRTLGALSEETAPLASTRRAPSSTLHNFPNQSVGNLLSGPQPRIVTPSWSDFAATGFGSTVDEFGLVNPGANGADEFPKRSQTVGVNRAKDLTRSSPSSSSALVRKPLPKPSTKIVSVTYLDLDEEFLDVYLDTLVDEGACSSWPSFLVAELRANLVLEIAGLSSSSDTTTTTFGKVEALLVSERLISLSAEQSLLSRQHSTSASTLTAPNTLAPTRSKAGSIPESSTLSRKWSRRASSIFGSSSANASKTSLVSPQTSPKKSRSNGSTAPPPIPELPGGGGESLGLVRTISRTLGGRKRSKSSIGGGSDRPASPVKPTPPTTIHPPLPSDYTLEELRRASSSADRPVPQSPTKPRATSGLANTTTTNELPSVQPTSPFPPVAEFESKKKGEMEDGEAGEGEKRTSKSSGGLVKGLVAGSVVAGAATAIAVAVGVGKKSGGEKEEEKEKQVVEKKSEEVESVAPVVDAAPAPAPAHEAEPVVEEQKEVQPEPVVEPTPAVVESEPTPAFDSAAAATDRAIVEDHASLVPVSLSQPDPTPLPSPTPLDSLVSSPQESLIDPLSTFIPASIPGITTTATEEASSASLLERAPAPEPTAADEAAVAPLLEKAPEVETVEPVEEEPTAKDEASVAPLLQEAPTKEDEAFVEVEQPVVDEVEQEKRFSSETIKPEESIATVDEPIAQEESLVQPVAPEEPVVEMSAHAEPVEHEHVDQVAPFSDIISNDEPTLPADAVIPFPPSTPIKSAVASDLPTSPTLSVNDEPMTRSLSQTSQLSAPSSPKSSGGSPSSTHSKKFLGGFLRKKKSSLEKEQARQDREAKAQAKEEMKQLKKLKEEEKKRVAKEAKIPTPVSSVKKRVQEIEAEAAGLDSDLPASPSISRIAASPSFTGSPISQASPSPKITSPIVPLEFASVPTTLTISSSVPDVVVDSASPAQENEHLAAKIPSALEDLPSPLPSPTPDAPSFEAEVPSLNTAAVEDTASIESPTTPRNESASLPLLATDTTPVTLRTLEPEPDTPTPASVVEAAEPETPTEPVALELPLPRQIGGPEIGTPSLDAAEAGVGSLGNLESALDTLPTRENSKVDLTTVVPDVAVADQDAAEEEEGNTTIQGLDGKVSSEDSSAPQTLRSFESDHSLAETATSFRTAASEGSSIADERPWEQAQA